MALPSSIIKKLNIALPPNVIKQKQSFDYISGYLVVNILNYAFDYDWDWVIVKEDEITSGNKSFNFCHGYIEARWNDIETGELRKIIKHGTGSQLITAKGGEDTRKGAYTDAIKKAATLFNIGGQLYLDQNTKDFLNGNGLTSSIMAPMSKLRDINNLNAVIFVDIAIEKNGLEAIEKYLSTYGLIFEDIDMELERITKAILENKDGALKYDKENCFSPLHLLVKVHRDKRAQEREQIKNSINNTKVLTPQIPVASNNVSLGVPDSNNNSIPTIEMPTLQ